MATQAKMKRTTEEVSAPTGDSTSQPVQPEYKLIPWKDLEVSPTNPRRRINQQTIESLAESIRTQEILEPLIVRQLGKKYEIVCGERRYRAASLAGKTELPCLIRQLTDEQVLDIQIHENLHREDVHPMDEAYSYQFLKEKLDCDIKELALRVGKSEGYVLNRLKLNQLIAEAQKDIDDGYLPLSYALEIAKYTPDIQKHVYDAVYRKEGKYQRDTYIYIPIKGQTVPWKAFIEWINTNIHRLLSKAPFDPKATNLRPDGLACVNCPERTGAAVSLFEPKQIGKKDACLNPACYVDKVKTLVHVRRRELAETSKVEPSEIPVVRSLSYSNGNEYLGSESAVVVGDIRGASKKKCKNVVGGIDVEADNYGQTVQVCLKTTNCKTHWPESNGSPSKDAATGKASGNDDARREAHRARREEIWNAKVAEAVRIRVFKQAAESFEKKFSIADVGTDFLPQFIARFWRMTMSGDSNNLRGIVKLLLAEWNGGSSNGNSIFIPEGSAGIEYVKTLKRGIQFRLLFVLVHCNKGTIGYGNNYSSQTEVKELSAEFEVDYALIDAEVRLESCPKKHKQVHQAYLDAVRAKSKDANVPKLFSEKWEAKN